MLVQRLLGPCRGVASGSSLSATYRGLAKPRSLPPQRGLSNLTRPPRPQQSLGSPHRPSSTPPSSPWTSARKRFNSSLASHPRRHGVGLAAALAIGGGGALSYFYFATPISNEANTSDDPAHRHDDEFAPTIDDLEDREANALVRLLSAIGNRIHDWIIEPLGTVKRFIVLFSLFFPVLVTMPMLVVGKRGQSTTKKRRASNGDEYTTVDEEGRWGAIWWYDFLVKQMERAGPTFIKLAQWAGSRQDLFPSSLCERLGKLHSNGKPHSLRYTKRVISRVFGRPFEEIFEEFGEEPLGIGAVAQVYKAKLKPGVAPLGPKRPSKKAAAGTDVVVDDGKDDSGPRQSVAIKVLHPKVHRTIARDIREYMRKPLAMAIR